VTIKCNRKGTWRRESLGFRMLSNRRVLHLHAANAREFPHQRSPAVLCTVGVFGAGVIMSEIVPPLELPPFDGR